MGKTVSTTPAATSAEINKLVIVIASTLGIAALAIFVTCFASIMFNYTPSPEVIVKAITLAITLALTAIPTCLSMKTAIFAFKLIAVALIVGLMIVATPYLIAYA